MISSRRNLLYPLLTIAVGVTMLLLAVDVLPEGVGDLMQRSWAAVIVLIGLNMLLGERVRFGNWLSLLLVGLSLGAIIFLAYDARSDEVRTDYAESLEPIVLGDHIERVNVVIESANTTVNLRPALNNERAIAADFVGSTESQVTISAQEQETTGILDFTIIEHRPNRVPNLDDVGRGELNVYLPVGVALDLNFTNRNGLVTLDFQLLDIPRFNIEKASGDIELYMPVQGVVIGDVNIEEGNIQIFTPPENSLRVTTRAKLVEVNINDYARDESSGVNIIETRGGLATFQFSLEVNVPNGTLTIKAPGDS